MINYFKKENYLSKLDSKRQRASKIEEQQQQEEEVDDEEDTNNVSLIQFPWDDDGFSLCLDTFPSVNYIKKFNAYPTTGSPLRKHWENEESSEEEEDVGSTRTKDKESSLGSTSTASIPQSAKSDPLPEKKTLKDKKRKKNTKKLSLFFKKMTDNDTFPYKNDTHFLNEKETLKAPLPVKQRGHVEHISPLSNSSLLNDSLMMYPSIRKIPSHSSSIKSQSTYSRGGGSIHNGSVISDAASVESWKIVQSPVHGLTSSAVVLPISSRQQYKPTPSHEYDQFQSSPVSRSASIAPSSYHTRSGAATPLQLPMNYSQQSVNDYGYHGGYYYNPTSPSSVSPSVTSSYRSVPVPRNADELTYFSNTPSVYSEKRRTSYSQFFNPSYQSDRNNKKNRSNKPKRSGSLLSKLVRNIKHHFVKHQESS